MRIDEQVATQFGGELRERLCLGGRGRMVYAQVTDEAKPLRGHPQAGLGRWAHLYDLASHYARKVASRLVEGREDGRLRVHVCTHSQTRVWPHLGAFCTPTRPHRRVKRYER